MNLTRNN